MASEAEVHTQMTRVGILSQRKHVIPTLHSLVSYVTSDAHTYTHISTNKSRTVHSGCLILGLSPGALSLRLSVTAEVFTKCDK